MNVGATVIRTAIARTLDNSAPRVNIENARYVAQDDAGAVPFERAKLAQRSQSGGTACFDRPIAHHGIAYSVNTWYGGSCPVGVPRKLVTESQLPRARHYVCGPGQYTDYEPTLAVLSCHLDSLAQHCSDRRWGPFLDV